MGITRKQPKRHDIRRIRSWDPWCATISYYYHTIYIYICIQVRPKRWFFFGHYDLFGRDAMHEDRRARHIFKLQWFKLFMQKLLLCACVTCQHLPTLLHTLWNTVQRMIAIWLGQEGGSIIVFPSPVANDGWSLDRMIPTKTIPGSLA